MGGFTPKMVDFVSGSLVIGKVMAKGYCEDNSQDTDRKESGTNIFFQKSSAIYLLQTGLSLTTSHLCLITPSKYESISGLIIDQVRTLGLSYLPKAHQLTNRLWHMSFCWRLSQTDSAPRLLPHFDTESPTPWKEGDQMLLWASRILHNSYLLFRLCLCLKSRWQWV